jgi:formate hydrogenlyase subunit 4
MMLNPFECCDYGAIMPLTNTVTFAAAAPAKLKHITAPCGVDQPWPPNVTTIPGLFAGVAVAVVYVGDIGPVPAAPLQDVLNVQNKPMVLVVPAVLTKMT